MNDPDCPPCGPKLAVVARAPYGRLAHRVDGRRAALEVLYSARGYYIGTSENGLPYSRESSEYWTTAEQAQLALDEGRWTQKLTP